MGATNTPLYDLIELSGIGAFATYTTTPGGGGDIIGFVDNATYTDLENNNSATEITEINETTDADNGLLTIDGVTYNIQIYTPTSTSNPVSVTYNDGASTVNLTGDDGTSQVAWIIASPLGGGSDRYFMAVDDGVGDLPDITQIQTTGIDFDPAGDDVKINLDQNNNITVCFTGGTLIDTPCGARAVESLRPGDMVQTLDHGPQPLIWTGQHAMGPMKLAREPHLKPVLVPEGVLGATRPLLVSPQHCILINPHAPRAEQRFARARHLAQLPGPIRIAHGKRHVSYHHLLLRQHQVLMSEGMASESFYPGPQGLAALTQPARLSVLAHFPMLLDQPVAKAYGPTARPVMRRKDTQALPRLRRQTVSQLIA